MLLVGSDPLVDALITAVTGRTAASFPAWTGHEPFTSPDVDDTCIVRDVHRLTDVEQQRLHRDLEIWSGRVRFIATAAWPVYPLVERGEFHEGLYYRLNMVCLESPTAAALPREAMSQR